MKSSYTIFSLLIIVGFCTILWLRWQQKNHRLEKASIDYLEMLSFMDRQNKDQTKKIGFALIKEYSTTPYACLAAFILAKEAVIERDLVLSHKNLQFVIKNKNCKNFHNLAIVRDARVLIGMKKYEEAIKILTPKKGSVFYALVYEIISDALIGKGKIEEAKQIISKIQDFNLNIYSPLLKFKMQQF